MAQRIVGLDLGSYSIKVVHVVSKGRAADFEVARYDEALLPPPFEITDGVQATLQERQALALQELRERGALEGDVFVTGLPGDVAAVRTLRFPFSDARKIQQTLPFELEAELPFDLDEIVVSWTVLGPVASREGPPETEVLAAYAKRDAIAALLELLQDAGVDPRYVEFDALVLDDLFRGVLRRHHDGNDALVASTPGGTVIEMGPDAPQAATAIVDLGHRHTSVCLMVGDRVISAQTLLHGGHDATLRLARELGLTVEEAERGKKKEAFIEVAGAVAQFPEQARVSEILKAAYAPIGKRLRQIFQAALSTQRVRVTRVFLTGGGSCILNLDRHLSEVLNVRVERSPDLARALGPSLPLTSGSEASPDAPGAALALGYALSGFFGDKTQARIDFRTGEFAWKGELDFLRERAPALGIWAAVLLFAVGVSGGVRAWSLAAEEEGIRSQQAAACRAITGMEIDSASRCLAIIQEKINGQSGFSLPSDSAVDHYLTLSRRMPATAVMQRKVTELDVNPERARVVAVVPDFDAVDKVVAALGGGRCFESLEKGKARNVSGGVEFNVLIRLDCEKSPGDGKEQVASARSGAATPARGGRGEPVRAESRDSRAQPPPAVPERRPPPMPETDSPAGLDQDTPAVDDDETGRERSPAAANRAERLKKLQERREELRRVREDAAGGIRGRGIESVMPDGLRNNIESRRGIRPLRRAERLPGDDDDEVASGEPVAEEE
ncbi:MAG: pilus assembly protein PilM [Myxococcota bacterium]